MVSSESKKKQQAHGVQFVTIDQDSAGQRIDNYLITYWKNVPKSRIYRLIRKGEVRVNKKRIAVLYRLQANDVLRLPPIYLQQAAKQVAPSEQTQDRLKNCVLFESEQLLIINKPAGMAVHGGSTIRLGIVEALRHLYPDYPHLELAHRLDADTSGVLVLAKRKQTLRELHQLLRDGAVKKEYIALTLGKWRKDELLVNAPLHKGPAVTHKQLVKVHKEGKQALTIFKTLNVYPSASLMAVRLHTGRTHQIRVHASYMQHPIAGDDRYGDAEFNKAMRAQGLKRMFLHAKAIEFVLPSTQERICVEAPLDEELQQFLDQWQAA